MQVAAGAARREFHVVWLISVAHFLSHIYMLALVPLYPLLRKDLGIGFTEVGLAATVLAVFTGGLQAPMGFLVDRIGGRKILIAGLFVNAAAIGLIGFVTSFWQLLALLAIAGVGSSVFHPADYSILSVAISEKRLGRAFAAHSMGGQLGAVVVAPLMVGLEMLMPWRHAVMVIGVVGVILAVVMLALSSVIGEGGHTKKKESAMARWRALFTSRPVMLFFIFYLGSSAGNAGMVQFSMTAFNEIYGLPLAVTAWVLTVYQATSLLAVLPGGWLADRTQAHDWVLVWCYVGAAVLVVLGGIGIVSFWPAVVLIGIAGALRGLMNAARDVSVRHAAGNGLSVGTVFAFVTTGYSVGQSFGPPIYGLLLDYGSPEIVFWASAVFSLISVSTVFIGRSTRTRVAVAE